MSIYEAYKHPIDIYLKLLREASRLWKEPDITNKSDFFFNFCVTSLSLRDWCINHLKLQYKDKGTFQNRCRDNIYIKYCSDIANLSKHLILDADRKTDVLSVNHVVDELICLLPDGSYSTNPSYRDSFRIMIKDSEPVGLMVFIHNVCQEWQNIITEYKLGKFEGQFIAAIFIENYEMKFTASS